MKEPKIDFPCDYPIKVIGDAHPGFLDEVFEIMRRHDSSLVMEELTTKSSRKGNFDSITVRFHATGEDQLKRVFEDLKECESVRMVL
ncbi:MAG: DUF493 domain-containing protein [Pseudomonadales bacterium]|nr:DUF493 domain-containing protein [Pseudomonadales bacterium]